MTKMPTKDELIKAGAVALCETDNLNPYYLEPGDILGIDGENAKGEPCHFYWREYSDKAEAALEAMLSMLPEGQGFFNQVSGDTVYKEEFESGFYRELLAMREKRNFEPKEVSDATNVTK